MYVFVRNIKNVFLIHKLAQSLTAEVASQTVGQNFY